MKKININRLDQADLSKIPFLTPLQIRNLNDYLNQYGEVFSMYELQAVEGFDSTIIHRLQAYMEIGTPPVRIRLTPGNLVSLGRHEVVFRYQQVIQTKEGYNVADSSRLNEPDSYYLGSPQRYYFRYRYTFYDRLVIGISGDKDAGEEFFSGSQPLGMDFYSGFIAVKNLRWMKQLIVGNFRASFGQGLTLGGSSFGSSVSFGSTMKYNAGFAPSQSVCEYGYLRGAALTIRTGRVEWSGFFSTTNKDASVYPADSVEAAPLFFSSFTETGYHRTQAELSRKKQVREWVYGGHASYRGRFFLIGLTGFYGNWSGALQPKDEVYKHFTMFGDRFGVLGIDGRFRVASAQLFGEFSISLNGGRAWLAGISAVPVSGIDLLLICRSYQPEFQNPFSTSISQKSMTVNEQGLFIRLQTQVIPKTTITGYVDLFRFPWLRYNVNGSSEGVEAGVSGHYQASPFWSLSLRYGLKRGEVNSHYFESKTLPMTEERRDDLKVEFNITAIPTVYLRSCIALRNYRRTGQQRESGYLASQEIAYRRAGMLRAIRMKYTLFDVPYYNARIYTYEPDVLYSWSVPACYGKGFRCVLLIQAGIARRVELWGWLGVTKYMDRNTIGSGLESISGSLKSEVKVQVRVRL
ncbi:MAG: helix-hairpin-helix domain-containing protein [Bacteroidia bacterium]|nr:helix-hairpin-helix domain-containing protein [Bacteroidia bacterium]